ncbi:GDP-mannose mannosyl hydrolase [Neptunomonas qingdaonensis]|uniref:Colanic acid biosynthesis protein WcaH n=1 Tax=Neptunomonas qingdaonensis TaxID=1045558 RepID=A0A1I2VSG9_9GAMM|nr:GDP-mannose mannosyl hydrolase [Neptunomonas qingdaonensis]SFG92090.1 colanic acid biosynthesis protein WcaH [Neptunomonas qingdaonensis]
MPEPANTFLSDEQFRTVVDLTPLISLDLIVKNQQGEILLGMRNNRPAQGFWFVPGGRVLKDETLAAAFLRLTQAELGIAIEMQQARHMGLYEHFYPDSIFGDKITTHYVVNAFELVLDTPLAALPEHLPKLQHSDYAWWLVSDLLAADVVHMHTKWYVKTK